MAFCTSCGATVDAGKKFCSACGAALPVPAAAAAVTPGGAAAAPAPAAAQQPAKGGSSALKIVLAILGVFFLLIVLAVGGVIYLGYRAKKAIENATVTTGSDGKTSVNTPWGSIESNDNADPEKILQELGLEAYPGAAAVSGSAKVATMGKLHTAGVKFTTSDSAAQVFSFYKGKYATAMTSSSGERYSLLIAGKNKPTITIAIQPYEGQTQIDIASMGAPAEGSDEQQ